MRVLLLVRGASSFGAGRVYFWLVAATFGVGRVYFWCGARLLLVVLERVYWGASTFGVGHVYLAGARLSLGGSGCVYFFSTMGCVCVWSERGASTFVGAHLLLRARLVLGGGASTFGVGRVYFCLGGRVYFWWRGARLLSAAGASTI